MMGLTTRVWSCKGGEHTHYHSDTLQDMIKHLKLELPQSAASVCAHGSNKSCETSISVFYNSCSIRTWESQSAALICRYLMDWQGLEEEYQQISQSSGKRACLCRCFDRCPCRSLCYIYFQQIQKCCCCEDVSNLTFCIRRGWRALSSTDFSFLRQVWLLCMKSFCSSSSSCHGPKCENLTHITLCTFMKLARFRMCHDKCSQNFFFLWYFILLYSTVFMFLSCCLETCQRCNQRWISTANNL